MTERTSTRHEANPQWEKMSKEEFIKSLEYLQQGDAYPFDLVWITYVPQEGKPYPQLLKDTDAAVFVRGLRATFEKPIRVSGSAYLLREHLVPVLPDELVEPLEETIQPSNLEHRPVLCLVLGERKEEPPNDRVGGAMASEEGRFPLESIDQTVHVVRKK